VFEDAFDNIGIVDEGEGTTNHVTGKMSSPISLPLATILTQENQSPVPVPSRVCRLADIRLNSTVASFWFN